MHYVYQIGMPKSNIYLVVSVVVWRFVVYCSKNQTCSY